MSMHRFLLLFCLALNCSISALCQVAPTTAIIETFTNGSINWTAKYIEATGKTYINHQIQPAERGRDLALRGAEITAKANLLEILGGVKITSTTTIKNMMVEESTIEARVEGVVKDAKMIGKPIITQDAVEITVRMPLYDNSLTPALAEKIVAQPLEVQEVEVPDTPASSNPKKRTSKPVETQQLLVPIGDTAAVSLKFPDGKYEPNLFPIIVDEEGNVVVNMAKEYKKYAGKYGSYVDATEEVLKQLKAQKALETLNAVQDSDGVVHINTSKKPKVKAWLKKAAKYGSVAIPIILSII